MRFCQVMRSSPSHGIRWLAVPPIERHKLKSVSFSAPLPIWSEALYFRPMKLLPLRIGSSLLDRRSNIVLAAGSNCLDEEGVVEPSGRDQWFWLDVDRRRLGHCRSWVDLGSCPKSAEIGAAPGDIVIERANGRFYFPIVTCIVISVLLNLAMLLFRNLML